MVLNEAVSLIDEGDLDRAGAILVQQYLEYKDKSQKPPNFAYVQYNLARVYDKKGQFKKAEILLKEILRENTEFPGAYFLLGEIYEKWSEKDNHLKSSKAAFSKIPSNASNYDSAQKILSDVNKQLTIEDKLVEYEAKEPEYFDDKKIFTLGTLAKDIHDVKICSDRDEFYFRIAQVVSKVKSGSFQKMREEGKSLREIYKSTELNVLDMVLKKYIEDAGFET